MRLDAPKKPTTTPAPVNEQKPARTDETSAPIRCRACSHVITHTASRREVGGRHVHLRLNPHAFAFIFGCFSTAPGCVVHGPPTLEATWFSGCRWEYAHCAQCLAHLGWSFSGDQSFFALLLERLVDEGS
ncbi:MAG: cereblon family protein [Archangium sp.]|nr:cereblon family protein [Archangium sp.]